MMLPWSEFTGGARPWSTRLRPSGVLFAAGLSCLLVVPSLPAQDQSLRELRRISATAYDLSLIAVAAAGADGAMWVSQPEDGVIVGLPANGVSLQLVGQRGEGPGDLRAVAQILVRPHGLWIVDMILRRTTAFDATGRVLSTSTLPAPPQGLVAATVEAASPGGDVWWRSLVEGGDRLQYTAVLGGSRTRGAVLRVSRTGCTVSGPNQGRTTSISVPFCHASRVSMSSDGHFGAVATPLTPVDGRSGIRVIVVSVNGDTVLSREVRLDPSPIPDAVRDSAINSRLGRGRPGPLTRQMIDGDLIPRVYSPIVDLRVSDDGDVLAEVVAGRGAERRLVVLRRENPVVSMLPMKRTQSLRWFGGKRFLVTDEDEEGFQDVVLYEIIGNR